MSNPPNKPGAAVVVAKREIRDMLSKPETLTQIQRALPKHMTADRMARIVQTALMKTPALLACTPESVMNCMMICSQAGLEPDGRLAHLIPYGTTCQVVFDYKGIIALVTRNKSFDLVYAGTVYEKDQFDASIEDGRKVIRHKPSFLSDRGPAILYYAVTLKGTVCDWEVMNPEEVEAIRGRSKAGKNGPWVTDFNQMAQKTVVRRMSKRWDLLPEIADMINGDDDVLPEIRSAPAIGRPLFDMPATAALPAGESLPVESETEQDPDALTAVEASPSTFNSVKALYGLLKAGNIPPAMLLDYWAASGKTDGSDSSLEEAELSKPGLAQATVNEWANVGVQLLAAKKAGAK